MYFKAKRQASQLEIRDSSGYGILSLGQPRAGVSSAREATASCKCRRNCFGPFVHRGERDSGVCEELANAVAASVGECGHRGSSLVSTGRLASPRDVVSLV